jgi:LuxR family maltose regulon positive regulatory protein
VLSHLAQGAVELAEQTVESLAEFEQAQYGQEDLRTQSLRARVELAKGQLVRATNWAEALHSAPPDGPLMWLAEAPLTMALAYTQRNHDGDPQRALQILDMLDEFAVGCFNVRLRIELLALRAVIRAANSQPDALRDITQALVLAAPGGFIRVFLDLGAPMQRLLQTLASAQGADDFLHEVLSMFPKHEQANHGSSHASVAAAAEPIEHLTPRELEILGYMRMRLTDKEIASRLTLSIVTVKRHATNLYAKLGVNRRWDAVAKAELLGLLPPD